MALVRAIGIDTDRNGKVLLTYEIIKTQNQDKQGGNSNEVVQGIGKTVPEAFDSIQAIVPGELFLGFVTTIIISESAAKQHLKTIMDLLFITPNVRESIFLVFTKEKPESILRMPVGKSGMLIGDTLMDIFRVTTRTGVSFPVRLREFNKMLMSEGVEPVAPVVEISESGKLKVSDMAVFNGFKLAGILHGDESKGLGRITNQRVEELSSILIKAPGTGDSVSAAFRLQDNKTKMKIKSGHEIPEVFISVKATATMVQFDGNVGAITSEILRECEKGLEGKVKSELEATIAKAQKEYKSDFIGIGSHFYQQHRKEWKGTYKPKWDDVFPEVPIHVQVKVRILNSGTKVMPLQEE